MATTTSQVQDLTNSGTNYMEAAKQLTATDNAGTTPAPTPIVANPNGAPVDTTDVTTPKVNEVTTPTITPSPIPTTTTPEASIGNEVSALSNIGATALSEGTSQQELTTKLAAIDKQQLDTKIANATANEKEFANIAKAQMIDKTANEIEYQKELQSNQQAEIASLRLQQESENVANQAAAADMKLKQENAERELNIANDIALQKSNIAFAKLGLSFSGAAVNQAQQVFTNGMYNLSSLKSGNAKDYADLQVKINTVQFDHIREIGTLVVETAEKEFASKERLREFIGDTQNNILMSKKEAQTAIQDAITTYKTEAQSREDKLYTDMNNANARLATATQAITTSLTASQEIAKKKIDMYLNNGQWASLAPETKAQLESAAGVPAGTSAQTATVTITQGINSRLKDLVGSAVAIPTVTLQNMQNDVQKYMKLGYPLPTSIQLVVDKYKNQIPEVKAAETAATNKATLANAKTQAEIDKLASEAKQNLSEIDIAKAKLVLAKSSVGGASSGKIASFVTADGMPLTEKGGALYKLDGTLYGTKEGESIKNKESIVDYAAKEAASLAALKAMSEDDGLVDTPTAPVEESDIPWVPFI